MKNLLKGNLFLFLFTLLVCSCSKTDEMIPDYLQVDSVVDSETKASKAADVSENISGPKTLYPLFAMDIIPDPNESSVEVLLLSDQIYSPSWNVAFFTSNAKEGDLSGEETMIWNHKGTAVTFDFEYGTVYQIEVTGSYNMAAETKTIVVNETHEIRFAINQNLEVMLFQGTKVNIQKSVGNDPGPLSFVPVIVP